MTMTIRYSTPAESCINLRRSFNGSIGHFDCLEDILEPRQKGPPHEPGDAEWLPFLSNGRTDRREEGYSTGAGATAVVS